MSSVHGDVLDPRRSLGGVRCDPIGTPATMVRKHSYLEHLRCVPVARGYSHPVLDRLNVESPRAFPDASVLQPDERRGAHAQLSH
jgi:hypothetical protein